MTTLSAQGPYHVLTSDSLYIDEDQPGPHHLGIAIETTRFAVSQYYPYDFNSFCVLDNGVILGSGQDGLYRVEYGDTDNDATIDAMVESPTLDFSIQNAKRVRSVHLGVESSGILKVSLLNDDGNLRSHYTSPAGTSQLQESGKVSFGRDGKGRYWTFRVENVQGCDFSLDAMDVVMVILGRKPSGSQFS